MKIFQIHNGYCWWDATATVGSIENASTMFPPECVFVEAPDFVFEGWGYDEHAEGDERFVQPETPDGWDYDDGSGTFSPTPDDSTGNSNASIIAENNISGGKYFTAGGRLYQSTGTITKGETISPGVNCTEISVADALNALDI